MATKPKNKFYAWVRDGKQGIAGSWAECEAIVKGATARYRGFLDRAEAEAWLAGGARYEPTRKVKERRQYDLPADGIYFDAGTGRGHGTEARVTDRDGTPLTFMAVEPDRVTAEGNVLLRGRTNNYGELTACRMAIEIAMKLGRTVVLGDSKLVIEYWSQGKIRKDTAAGDDDLLRLVRQVQRLRREFEAAGGRLVHISGDVNPADLGFHK